jgi:predicted ATPase
LQLFVGKAGGADTILYYGAKETPFLWGALGFEAKTGDSMYYFHLAATEAGALIFSKEEVRIRTTKAGDLKNHLLGSGYGESRIAEDESFRELRDLLSEIHVYHFEDTSDTSPIRRRGYIEDNRSLRSDGGNLAAFLYGLREAEPLYYRRIVSTIRQIAPFFDDFDLAPMRIDENSIILNWRDRDSDHLFGPHQLSDGTLRSMALVALLSLRTSSL